MTANPVELAKTRPAETTTGIAGAVAYFIARIFDLNGTDVAMLTILVGFIPTAVTGAVELVRYKRR